MPAGQPDTRAMVRTCASFIPAGMKLVSRPSSSSTPSAAYRAPVSVIAVSVTWRSIASSSAGPQIAPTAASSARSWARASGTAARAAAMSPAASGGPNRPCSGLRTSPPGATGHPPYR